MASKTADPFDLKRLTLTREDIRELEPLQKKQPKPSSRTRTHTEFVKLPYAQTLAAAGHLGDARLAVLVELTHQAFKKHRSEVLLANAALQAVGISHWAKLRALRQLEAAGMLKVSRRGKGRSPLVKLLWK
jgi:hypothetical protein